MPFLNPSIPLQPVAIASPERSWISEQARAHTCAAHMAEKVRDAHVSGKRMQPVMRTYLRNPQVRLSGALRALGGNPSRGEAMALRDRVNEPAVRYCPVRWHAQKKSSGGERYICTLPLELKALHYMLKRPLEHLFDRNANIYGVKSFSRDDLATEIKTLQNAGYVHIATTDVIDCYQSVDPDAIYQLPLPREVIRNTLDTRNIEFERTTGNGTATGSDSTLLLDNTTYKASGPSGLIQGSPISGIILAWLLNGIPSRDSARVFLCFDNLIVLANTPSETRAMVNTLVAHFEQCSAGPLALCDPEFADNEPIEFLGYLFDPERKDIGIADRGRERLLKTLNEAEREHEAACYSILQQHQQMCASNSLLEHHNPLMNHLPVRVWKALLSFRAGFPKVEPDAPELKFYLENSRWTAERTDDPMIVHLHDHLFSAEGTDDARAIRAILNRHSDLSEGYLQ